MDADDYLYLNDAFSVNPFWSMVFDKYFEVAMAETEGDEGEAFARVVERFWMEGFRYIIKGPRASLIINRVPSSRINRYYASFRIYDS